jgi:STE24 endopeptidase
VLFFLVVIVTFFTFLRWSLDSTLARWGAGWGVRGITDVAVLPLVLLIASVFFFALTPVFTTFTRTQELEADMYGLTPAASPTAPRRARFILGSTAR